MLRAAELAGIEVDARVTPGGWVWPQLKDPRLPFAAILTLYAVLGFTVLGFNRSPAQMLTLIASGCALDAALAFLLRGARVVPLSAYITSCSLALLLNYAHASWLLFLPVYLAIGSKYLLTFRDRHIFNPSMFGVAVPSTNSRSRWDCSGESVPLKVARSAAWLSL